MNISTFISFCHFVSTALKKAEPISKENSGVIGLDLNTDHIACVELMQGASNQLEVERRIHNSDYFCK